MRITGMGSDHNVQVLFFGRRDCAATKKGLAKMKESNFDVDYIESGRRGEKMPDKVASWTGDYIFSYRSFFILSQEIIDRATVGAINFHPGPPDFPGSGCINFALYNNANEFGVTAHLMNAQVDNGRILEVRRFPVAPEDNLPSLLEKTHQVLESQFLDFIDALARDPSEVRDRVRGGEAREQWVGSARKMKDLEELKTIPLEITEDELERVIRATYIPGYAPRIRLHGYEFELISDVK